MIAASYAPSCANRQPWRFIVAQSEKGRGKIIESLTSGNYWAKKAPVLIAALTKKDLDCNLSDSREYAAFDLGLSVSSLMIQATKEGLIAHPMAGFDPLKIKELFSVPEDYVVLAVIAVGYPGSEDGLNEKHLEDEHSDRKRKPLDEVVFFDRFVTEPEKVYA